MTFPGRSTASYGSRFVVVLPLYWSKEASPWVVPPIPAPITPFTNPSESLWTDLQQLTASRLCLKAQVAHRHPHQLRHNAATRLAEEFGPEIACIILGHRSIQVTRRYIKDQLGNAAEGMRQSG